MTHVRLRPFAQFDAFHIVYASAGGRDGRGDPDFFLGGVSDMKVLTKKKSSFDF